MVWTCAVATVRGCDTTSLELLELGHYDTKMNLERRVNELQMDMILADFTEVMTLNTAEWRKDSCIQP